MKRIMNDVAVQTLLYTMSPIEVVKILDADHHTFTANNPWNNTSGSFGLTYTVDEILHNYENVKIAKAKIYATTVNEGKLLLVIDTKNEKY